MNTPVDQLPWSQIQIAGAVLLNWIITQIWKRAVPTKPVSPVLVSSIVGGILGTLIAGIQGHETPEQIFWAVFVAVTSVFGGSAVHWMRSTRRSLITIAEQPTETAEGEECPAP